MKHFLIAIALLLPLADARADDSPPVLYSRAHILIHTQATTLPWQSQSAAVPSGLLYDVVVRDAKSFYHQQGWYNMTAPADMSGILLVFNSPTKAAITHADMYAPLDILLVDDEGTIRQIYPNLILSEIDNRIVSDVPVLAFLLLKGGSCAAHGIKPGDTIEYKIFRKGPPVLTTGASSPAAAIAPAPAASPAASALGTLYPEQIATPTAVRRAPINQQIQPQVF